ncbi:MAG TPA: efflux RND transporter permease subunit [Terriglobales bacterium]
MAYISHKGCLTAFFLVVIRAVRIGLAGEEESTVWIGQRRFDLVLRLRDQSRNSPNDLGRLLIDGHDGSRIPLGQLASIEQTFGLGAIRRESGSRRVAVEASVHDRDLGSTAAEVRDRLSRELKLPTGYFFDVGGRVEAQARAGALLESGDRGGRAGGIPRILELAPSPVSSLASATSRAS